MNSPKKQMIKFSAGVLATTALLCGAISANKNYNDKEGIVAEAVRIEEKAVLEEYKTNEKLAKSLEYSVGNVVKYSDTMDEVRDKIANEFDYSEMKRVAKIYDDNKDIEKIEKDVRTAKNERDDAKTLAAVSILATALAGFATIADRYNDIKENRDMAYINQHYGNKVKSNTVNEDAKEHDLSSRKNFVLPENPYADHDSYEM